jgi:hypothetical protein
MKRLCIICFVALCASYCAPDINISTSQQAGSSLQGPELQATQLQGGVTGMTMSGFRFAGATLNGSALSNVHIASGELVADQNGSTLHGASLKDAHLYAEVRNLSVNPPTTTVVEYQISDVQPEDAVKYDPTQTGATYLYTLKQNVDGNGNWQLACPADADGRHAAIPIAATWDEHGARVESTTLFTFGCTAGAIARCYRWGYRPWVTGYGDLIATHWACTRMARADYCGTGKSHTHEGTAINMWDNLPSPGPIQSQGTTPLLMLFEAGWNTSGAVCLSHARWLLGGPTIALGCPDRLIAPGLGILGVTVCDTTAQVLGQSANARIYNESYLNLNLDVLGL